MQKQTITGGEKLILALNTEIRRYRIMCFLRLKDHAVATTQAEHENK
jgi:hypothetical protein